MVFHSLHKFLEHSYPPHIVNIIDLAANLCNSCFRHHTASNVQYLVCVYIGNASYMYTFIIITYHSNVLLLLSFCIVVLKYRIGYRYWSVMNSTYRIIRISVKVHIGATLILAHVPKVPCKPWLVLGLTQVNLVTLTHFCN